MSTTKKVKTESDFNLLRKYLKECRVVSLSSPAMVGALKGLEDAEKRLDRDRKLQKKFSSSSVSTEQNGTTPMTSKKILDETTDDVVHVPKTPQNSMANFSSMDDSNDELNEWQDIESVPPEISQDGEIGSCSLLGRRLAEAAITRTSEASTRLSSPLAAIAVALHGALVSDILEFACTGIPQKQSSGFAAPVRELPKSVFLPDKWDASPNLIQLRYRKTGLGAVLLKVESTDGDTVVEVQLYPTSVEEPSASKLSFRLTEHLNLDSFHKAVAKDRRVSPTLHYKSLATLMTNFATKFDVGGTVVEDGSDQKQRLPYVDATSVLPEFSHNAAMMGMKDVKISNGLALPTRNGGRPAIYNEDVTPDISTFVPNRPPGHFDGDLGRPGVLPGGFGPSGGNLMGPNHPLFAGGGAPGPRSGFGMQPRFDPVGPPGVYPDDLNDDPLQVPGRGRGVKRRGEPNPDHLKPPPNLPNNMFM